jgi:hypothetical protein
MRERTGGSGAFSFHHNFVCTDRGKPVDLSWMHPQGHSLENRNSSRFSHRSAGLSKDLKAEALQFADEGVFELLAVTDRSNLLLDPDMVDDS